MIDSELRKKFHSLVAKPREAGILAVILTTRVQNPEKYDFKK